MGAFENRKRDLVDILKSYKLKISKEIDKTLQFRPDVLVKLNVGKLAFVLRLTDDIPDAFLTRIAGSKLTKKNLNVEIVFCKRLQEQRRRTINSLGIGVKILQGKGLKIIKNGRI